MKTSNLSFVCAILVVAGVCASATTAQAVLVRVDFQASTAPWTMAPSANGTEAAAISADAAFGSSGANIWDNRARPGHPAYGPTTFSNLLETSTGAATGISMSFTNISAAGDDAGSPPVKTDLNKDYLVLLDPTIVGVGSNSSDYTISGLTPNAPAKLFLYTSYFTFRNFNVTANGSGPMLVGNSGLLINTVANGAGQITGTWTRIGSEANWAGLQIFQASAVEAAPEPSSLALLSLLGLAAAAYCRRQKAAA